MSFQWMNYIEKRLSEFNIEFKKDASWKKWNGMEWNRI